MCDEFVLWSSYFVAHFLAGRAGLAGLICTSLTLLPEGGNEGKGREGKRVKNGKEG
jgi:hypothetical protein